MLRLNLILLSFVFLFFFSARAQNLECEQSLAQATAEFEAGRFYSISNILKPCLEKGFTKEQRVRAYLLLTQAYLVLDDPISAEDSYLKLLKADPEYIANPSHDPIDVYYLSKKFTTTPIFTPHFHAGGNISVPRIIHSVSTNPAPDVISKNLKVGYQFGAALDWNIDSRWSLSIGADYSFKNFKTNFSNINGADTKTFIANQDWIDVPIYLKYSIDTGRIRPFVYAGLAANILFGSKLSPVYLDVNGATQIPSTGPDESLTFKMNTFNRSFLFGGGVRVKQGINFFYVDVRYMAGMSNVVNPKLNYYDANGNFDPNLTKYSYVSDLYRLDNFLISVGFVKPIYDPRKKRKAVTSLMEKIGLKKNRTTKK